MTPSEPTPSPRSGWRTGAVIATAIALPLVLGLVIYLLTAGSLGASAGVKPIPTQTPAPGVSRTPDDNGSTPSTAPSPTGDHGGRCSEPEHSSDPSCHSGSGGSTSSSGSGGSESGSSGSGGGDESKSGNSGSGGGDD